MNHKGLDTSKQRRDELIKKIDALFAHNDGGEIDYAGTKWDDAKQAQYDGWMRELKAVNGLLDTAEHGVDPATALGNGMASVRSHGLNVERSDPLVTAMRPTAERVLDVARGVLMGAQTTTDAEGGYTVPIEVAPELEIHYADGAPMVTLATYQGRRRGNAFRVPVVDASGIRSTRVAENTSPGAATDLVFAQQAFTFDRFDTKIYTLTNELIQDAAVDLVAQFTAILLNQSLRSISDAATDGTGGSGMDGFTENSNVTSALTTGDKDAVTWKEIAALYGSISERAKRNAVVQFNGSVEAALFQQVDDDKKPVIVRDPNGGVAGTGGGTVIANGLSIPYALNPKLPALGTKSKAVYCGDFSRYRMFGAPNNNAYDGVEIVVFTDSAYRSKNTVGMLARVRRAGKYLSVASGHDCRFLTQKT